MKLNRTCKELTLRTEGETEFIHAIFMDGSSIDLKCPRSKMKIIERVDGKTGNVIYDCVFEDVELA